MTQLPEVREADAPPHIAEIYADIKQVAVLPQVNLIFRYFATHPGVLEWVWATLRPLYASRELIDAATQLTSTIDRPGPSPLFELLPSAEHNVVRRVLNAYNSGNPQNLIALRALVKLLDRRDQPRSSRMLLLTPREDSSTTDAQEFPSLPRYDALSSQVQHVVDRLAARHRRRASTPEAGEASAMPTVVPSLYLHMALWPAALESIDGFLQPIIESDDWEARVSGVIAKADASAECLLQGIELLREPPVGANLDEVAGTIRAFVKGTIPEMIVVGGLVAID